MRALLGLLLAIVLVLFALSNQQPVLLHLWPTDLALQAPLSLTVLIGMGAAFLVGALFTWTGSLGQRSRARRAEDTVRLLEAQVSALKARMPVTARMSRVDA